MKYIIDSSSLIDLKDIYRKSVFPDAWENVSNYLRENLICSCYEVFEELKAQEGDSIYKLIRQYPEAFIEPSKDIQLKVKEILRNYSGLIKIKSGKSGADPFVIATAMVHKVPVVTNEKKTGNIETPHIPDVCSDINHPCYTLVELFEKERFEFVNRG